MPIAPVSLTLSPQASLVSATLNETRNLRRGHLSAVTTSAIRDTRLVIRFVAGVYQAPHPQYKVGSSGLTSLCLIASAAHLENNYHCNGSSRNRCGAGSAAFITHTGRGAGEAAVEDVMGWWSQSVQSRAEKLFPESTLVC